MSGSPSEEDEGPPPTQRSALDPRTSSDHRRPYSPVAETVGHSNISCSRSDKEDASNFSKILSLSEKFHSIG